MVAAISRTSSAIVALRSEDDDLVARKHVLPRDVDGQHVHADRSDDRRAAAANQDRAAAGEPQVEAVGVPGGDDRDRRRTRSARKSRAVAADLARPHAFDGHDAAVQRHRGHERQRGRERRRHHAVQQEAGPDPVVPDTRIAQERGAVARVPVARAPAKRLDIAQRPDRSARAAPRNAATPGRRPSRSACRRRRARGSGSPAAPAANAAGCRAGTRGGSCPCRSSGGSAAAACSAPPRPGRPAPRRAWRWSASGGSRTGRRDR